MRFKAIVRNVGSKNNPSRMVIIPKRLEVKAGQEFLVTLEEKEVTDGEDDI